MSRYDIAGDNPALRVAVGWDRPLGTFFGYVADPALDEESNPVLWVGATPPWLRTVEQLAAAMAGYAVLSAEQRQLLEADQLAAPAR